MGDVPDDFVAAQLAAFGTLERAERWIEAHPVERPLVARAVSGERTVFAVLAGIYPDRRTARAALAGLPEALRAEVWYRSVGDLKAAIGAAEQAAAGTGDAP
jgi:septal ring-binding cell division protein DamX